MKRSVRLSKMALIEFLLLGWLALALVVVLYFMGLFEDGATLYDFGHVTLDWITIFLAYFLLAFLYLGIRHLQSRGEIPGGAARMGEAELDFVAYALEHPAGSVTEGAAMAEFLPAILGHVHAVAHGDGATLELIDGGVIQQGLGAGNAQPYQGLRQPAGGLVAVAMQTGETVNLPDIIRDPRAKQGPPMPADVKSLLVVPIKHGQKTLGVFRFFSRHGSHFGGRTPDVLKLIGSYTGATIWRSHDTTKQRDLMAEHMAALTTAQDARNRLEKLAEQIQSVYWVVDAKREKLLFVNDVYETLWGQTVESLTNNPGSWLGAVHPEDRPGVEAMLPKQAEGGYDVEYRVVRPDKSVVWIRERAFPILGDDKKLLAIASLAEDVTELRGTQYELQNLRQRLEYGLERGPMVFYAARPGGDYGLNFVSQNAENVLGHPARTFVDEPTFWSAHLHADDQTRVFEAFPKLFEKGSLVQEYRFLHKDGTYRLLRDDMHLLRTAEGEPIEIVGYWLDITDRKRAEEGLAYSLNRIKELQESRTRLLNTIAHDLASPLTPIGLQVELLQMSMPQASDKQKKSLEILLRNVAHMQRLVEDLKDLARLEAGQLKIDPKDSELTGIVQKAVDSFHETAKERGLSLAPKIPPSTVPVHADEQRITQVVFNFLTNALKFSPPGGSIAVEMTSDASQATVRVRDQGRGLSPEEIGRLFQPFSQVHDRSQMKEKGTGLGLFICKGLIEKHGGRIWAESQGHGKGSTFAFTIPLRGAVLPNAPAPPQGGTPLPSVPTPSTGAPREEPIPAKPSKRPRAAAATKARKPRSSK
ncbi:MAG: PAS domain-containing protein [Euryarchaeota archaeon]|nr:PAS domain-containing protein [Euryarchaeota archaeon]